VTRTSLNLMWSLWCQGAQFSERNGRLVVKARPGAIDTEAKAGLNRLEAQILDRLRGKGLVPDDLAPILMEGEERQAA